MKKFLLKVIGLVVAIVIFDVLFGLGFEFLLQNAKGGDSKRNNYICNEVGADVLIFGSSRAFHHYNPVIISDSLGMTCYNCGQDGNGSILNYGRYQLICQRYRPQVLIYDLFPSFDLLVGEDNHKYLGHLRPYYDRNGIAEIFESVDDTEKYKMKSNLYRYNSKFVQILSDNIIPQQSDGIQGFRPLNLEMDSLLVRKNKEHKDVDYSFDSLKINYLKRLVELSNETKFIFVVSPCWNGMDTTSLQIVKPFCQEHNIPILNYSNDSRYLYHNEYFKDAGHLNARGADVFTRDLMHDLKKRNILN